MRYTTRLTPAPSLGLHALDATKGNVTAYCAVSARKTASTHPALANGMWFEVSNGDETVTLHEDARGGSPAQACGGSEDAFRGHF